MKIEILGKGCQKCKMLEENIKSAIAKKGITAEIVKVTDVNKILVYDVMMTPAIVIDGKVVSSGRVLSTDEIIKLL